MKAAIACNLTEPNLASRVGVEVFRTHILHQHDMCHGGDGALSCNMMTVMTPVASYPKILTPSPSVLMTFS